MRQALLLLALSTLFAGCGTTERSGGASTSLGTDTGASPHADLGEPPPVILESQAGRQRAVTGSSCISYSDPSVDDVSVVSCADGLDPSPPFLSTVRPGEEIRIRVENGEVLRGTAHLHVIGCGKEPIAEIALSPGPVTTWTAQLEPGQYEIDFFLEFIAPARGGDFDGALGLLVDEAAPRQIVPTPGDVFACVGSEPVHREED